MKAGSFAVILALGLASMALAEEAKPPAVLFVFDASGSMLKPVGGKPKDQIARSVMATTLRSLAPDLRTGLVTFGHRRKKDCTDLEVQAPIGTDRAEIAKLVAAIKVKGETPLAEAIRVAGAQVKQDRAKDTIVVVSDGKDECGGDPCAVAKEIVSSGIPVQMHVIGFDVGEVDAAQLQCVAREGKGKYFSASSASQLGLALKEVERTVEAPIAEAPDVKLCPAPERGSTKPSKCTCSAGAVESGSVWGTDLYTDDSNVCRAAVHAGVIPEKGGEVTVYPYPGQDEYDASERHGIYASQYGHWDGSFGFAENLKQRTGGCPGSLAERPSEEPLSCDCTEKAASEGSVYGTDVYTSDSSICTSAVHAGVLKPTGGKVTVYPMPGQPSYDASERNGVTSSDYGTYAASFAFRPDVNPPKLPRCSGEILQEGRAVECRCRAVDVETGGVYGTDVYTADSGICRAAVHAGVMPATGGTVTVIQGPGRKTYEGGARNGIESTEYGEYDRSFSFKKK